MGEGAGVFLPMSSLDTKTSSYQGLESSWLLELSSDVHLPTFTKIPLEPPTVVWLKSSSVASSVWMGHTMGKRGLWLRLPSGGTTGGHTGSPAWEGVSFPLVSPCGTLAEADAKNCQPGPSAQG